MIIGCHGYVGKTKRLISEIDDPCICFRMPFETTSAICSILMGGVLEKYPKLRLAFAHGRSLNQNKTRLILFLYS